jgi:hypothetical protein
VGVSTVVDVLGSGGTIASTLENADKGLPNRFDAPKCRDIRKQESFEFEWLNVREKSARPATARGDNLLKECILHESTSLPRVPNADSFLHSWELSNQPVQVKHCRDIGIGPLAKRVSQEPHDALARQSPTSAVF